MSTRRNYRMGGVGVGACELYGGDPLVSRILLAMARKKPVGKYAVADAVEHDSRTRKRKKISLPSVTILKGDDR